MSDSVIRVSRQPEIQAYVWPTGVSFNLSTATTNSSVLPTNTVSTSSVSRMPRKGPPSRLSPSRR